MKLGSFNIENVFVAIRYMLAMAGVSSAQHYATDTWQFWALLGLSVASFGYGQYKTMTEQQIATTDSLPGVGGVAVSPELAKQIKSDTVDTIEKLAQKL